MQVLKEKLAHLRYAYQEDTGQKFEARIIPFGNDDRTFSVHYLSRKMYFLVGFRRKELGFSNFIHILDVVISDPKDRGKGWGSKVFSDFLQIAKQSNYDKILLQPKNELAQEFWSKWGFVQNNQKNYLLMELDLKRLRSRNIL